MLGVMARAGNASAGEGAAELVSDMVERCVGKLCESVIARMDAGFSDGKLFSSLEEQGTDYVARLRRNKAIDRLAAKYLNQPRSVSWIKPRTWCHELEYKADSWERPRRVVVVVVERPGELCPRHFYLVRSLEKNRCCASALLKLYRRRGAAEGYMGELKDVLSPSLCSTYRPKSHYRGVGVEREQEPCPKELHPDNETQLLLNLLAYEVMHLGRLMMKQRNARGWSLRRFRERVLNVAARVAVHSRKVKFTLPRCSIHNWKKLWGEFERLRYATA